MDRSTGRRARVNRDRGEAVRKLLRKLGYLDENNPKLAEDNLVEISSNLFADLFHLANNDGIALQRSGAESLIQNITVGALQVFFDDKRI
jgi:hypothetical protein